ncbi:hypothetical protein L1987_63670 [Smallanthus sonchifolius]|uniref:Uncharacterized protein n=1 Tax=Smallanthus sonchifolius TaxID=185202 RepID=A0ACB9CE01_9ASTR|nr:hypothetical protein L1987_63670 [Smallanthus sonchifolius]
MSISGPEDVVLPNSSPKSRWKPKWEIVFVSLMRGTTGSAREPRHPPPELKSQHQPMLAPPKCLRRSPFETLGPPSIPLLQTPLSGLKATTTVVLDWDVGWLQREEKRECGWLVTARLTTTVIMMS